MVLLRTVAEEFTLCFIRIPTHATVISYDFNFVCVYSEKPFSFKEILYNLRFCFIKIKNFMIDWRNWVLLRSTLGRLRYPGLGMNASIEDGQKIRTGSYSFRKVWEKVTHKHFSSFVVYFVCVCVYVYWRDLNVYV